MLTLCVNADLLRPSYLASRSWQVKVKAASAMNTITRNTNLRAWLPNRNGGWAQEGPGTLITSEMQQVPSLIMLSRKLVFVCAN